MNQQQSPPPLIAECHDASEKIDLYEKYGFYIKPIARLSITVQLPPIKVPGTVVPNSEILDKIRRQATPDEFIYLRVLKTTPEFIRCEGEVENKSSFKTLLARLDGSAIKMSAFADVIKVRAAEAKIVYPTRHDWDSYYKDAMNPVPVDELKPGERPDTVHFMDLPCRWFADRKATGADADKPCEAVLKEIFSIFGELRMVEIPDESINNVPTLKKVGSAVANELCMVSEITMPTFEAYVQYKDYISFVKAMDTFRGMKLLYIESKSEAYTANIRVDFDRTRRLSDKEIKRREIDKFKEIEIQKIRNAQMEKEKEKENKQREIANFRALLEESMGGDSGDGLGGNSEEKTKEQRRREREEARRQKRFAKKKQEEEKKFQQKVALEERKILIAHRKLESMRLLEELFNRVKVIVAQEELEKRQKEKEADDLKKQTEEAEELEAKRLRIEKEELELKEKIARKAEEMSRERQEELVEHFELRKEMPVAGSTESPEKTTSSSLPPMPRAVLLSNQQLLYQQQKAAKLYDEDDVDAKASDGQASNAEAPELDEPAIASEEIFSS